MCNFAKMGEEVTGALKVVVVGEPNVGKTWICCCFLHHDLPNIRCRYLQFDTHNIENQYKKWYSLHVWDVPGHYQISDAASFLLGNGGIIVVFDVTQEESFDLAVVKWIHAIHQRSKNIPVIVVGSKCDCVAERAVSKDRAQCVCDEMKLQYIEVSAKREHQC